MLDLSYENQYWVCRTWRLHGCKVTAQTVGFTLVRVTGEHNEHFGNQSAWNCGLPREPQELNLHLVKKDDVPPKVWNQKAVLLQNKHKAGSVVLQDPEGYLYIKKKSKGNGRVYLTCQSHCRYGCKGAATTYLDTLQYTSGVHVHHEKIRGGALSDHTKKKLKAEQKKLLDVESIKTDQ